MSTTAPASPSSRRGGPPGAAALLAFAGALGGFAMPAAPAATAPAWPAGPPAVLHPAVGDTLDAAEAARFGILAGVEGLRWAVFLPAPWGGHLLRFASEGPDGPVLRERNVPPDAWRRWRAQVEQVLAGRPPQDGAGTAAQGPPPPADSTAVWPEAPAPPRPAGGAAAGPPAAAAPLPNLSGHWYVLLEVGWRHDVSEWRTFFGDMALLALTTGPMAGRLLPWLRLEAGFGDMPDDLEEVAGDGATSAYGLAAGLSLRQPLGRRWGLLAGGGYGYFSRTLQWGGPFVDPFDPRVVGGEVVEQQDWGFLLRLGLTLQRPSPRPRLWELGISLHSTPAEPWRLLDDDGGTLLEADGRDLWLTLSVRFGQGV